MYDSNRPNGASLLLDYGTELDYTAATRNTCVNTAPFLGWRSECLGRGGRERCRSSRGAVSPPPAAWRLRGLGGLAGL